MFLYKRPTVMCLGIMKNETEILWHVIVNQWLLVCRLSAEVVQRCLIVPWLVPHETAAVSVRSVYKATSYNHAPCHVTPCKAIYTGCKDVQL